MTHPTIPIIIKILSNRDGDHYSIKLDYYRAKIVCLEPRLAHMAIECLNKWK